MVKVVIAVPPMSVRCRGLLIVSAIRILTANFVH
jgi:hypothetical protein